MKGGIFLKKISIIGGIIVLIFGALIALQMFSNKEKLKDNPYDKTNLNSATINLIGHKDYGNIILPKDLEERVKSKELFAAYFFSPTCMYCKEYTPVLMDVVNEYELDVPKLNLLEYGEAFEQYNITGTPTLIVFENGQEVNRIVGSVTKTETEAFFKDMGVIK